MNDTLLNTINANLEEAEIIANNIDAAKRKLQKSFRYDIKIALEKKLSDLYKAEIHGKIEDKEASVYLYSQEAKSKQLSICIIGFNGNEGMYVGIYNENGNKQLAAKIMNFVEQKEHPTLHVPACQFLHTTQGSRLHLGSLGTLKQFIENSQTTEYREALLEHTVKQIIFFAKEHYPLINEFSL